MKNTHKKLLLSYGSFLLATLLISCEKVVNLNLGNDTGRIVVEGNITNILGTQVITLSRNIPFTDTNNYPAVTGAKVSVADDKGNNYSFKEVQPGVYSIDNVRGVSGRSYTMTVMLGTEQYKATSTMPDLVPVDSIGTKKNDFDGTKKNMIVYYQDPGASVNQYKMSVYVNGFQVKSIFAFNDDFTNGRDVKNELRQNDIDIHTGDIVSIEVQNIDRPVYTYWNTLAGQQVNGPGGGTTPADPPSNISNNALGYFSAHTDQRKSIQVK